MKVRVGFLVAPAAPGALLYSYGFVKGYGTAAIVGPLLLIPFAYLATFLFGVPLYRLLDRKHVHRCLAYAFGGGLIGLAGSLLLNTPIHSLHTVPPGDLLIGAISGVISATVLWGIAVRGNNVYPQ